MNDSQWKVGAVLLAILVAVALLLRFGPTPEEEGDPQATTVVWSVEEAQITEIQVAHGEVTLHLRRDGEKWKVLAPFSYAADTRVVDALAGELAAIQKGIPVDGEKASYGLADPPVATVRLTLTDGKQALLKVGHPSPVGRKLYVEAEDGQAVAVTSDVHELLLADVEAFRDLRVVAFDPSQVDRATLSSAEGTLTVERKGGRWWLRGYGRADVDRVEDLLIGLLNIRLQHWEDPATSPPLEAVRHTASVHLGDGTEWVLQIGESDGTYSPIRVPGGSAAGVALTDELALLGQGPSDIGDPRAFPYDMTAVSEVAVDLPKGAWTLQFVGESWQRDGKPEPRAAAALEALQRAEVDFVLEAPPVWIETAGSIRIREGDSESRWEVGPEVDRWRWVRNTEGGDVIRVPAAAFGPIEAVFSGA